ncbi:MAG: hypothetical protein LBR07_08985 [Puniceicoccales bacterium]|jgi:hypothetical protein|nr:hypothetical protein [Puniceicoccales bacterium]
MNEHVNEHVILLHCLAGRPWFLRKVERTLRAAGYVTHNIAYPSCSAPIRELADGAVGPAIARCERAGAAKTHFVTHSLGGIVFRSWFARHTPPAAFGRAVLFAPPNHGSEVAQFFRRWWLFRKLFGPAGQELGTTPDSTPNRLGALPAGMEVGVIAGNRSYDLLFSSLLLPGPDDGKVTVASTCVEGMRAHCVVPATHTFIVRNRLALRQMLHFLRHGCFET